MKPSEKIEKLTEDIDFDYLEGCGARNCMCYTNTTKISAILKYLDLEKEK